MGGKISKFFRRRGKIEVEQISSDSERNSSDLQNERDEYETYLEEAESKFDETFEANSCPKEEMTHFKVLGNIGSGGHADVYLIQHRANRSVFALKALIKQKISNAKIEATVREKKLHYALEFPFIVKLHYAFQDAKSLYHVMDRALYGDLGRCTKGRMPDETIRFFVAQIILGLEYMHACKVMHRDLTPQNVLVFEDGYLKLSDFGSSKKVTGTTNSLKGTYAFMSPEMFGDAGYGLWIDWWALGVNLYRWVFERHPFALPQFDGKQLVHGLNHKSLSFPENFPAESPSHAFIEGLLEKDLSKRLGAMERGVEDIKEHRYFDGLSFLDVFHKRVRLKLTLAPVKPKPSKLYNFLAEQGETDKYPERFKDF